MGRFCCVKGCFNSSDDKQRAKSFFRFPLPIKYAQTWAKLLLLTDILHLDLKRINVCEDHFREEDIIKKKRKRIRKGCLPLDHSKLPIPVKIFTNKKNEVNFPYRPTRKWHPVIRISASAPKKEKVTCTDSYGIELEVQNTQYEKAYQIDHVDLSHANVGDCSSSIIASEYISREDEMVTHIIIKEDSQVPVINKPIMSDASVPKVTEIPPYAVVDPSSSLSALDALLADKRTNDVTSKSPPPVCSPRKDCPNKNPSSPTKEVRNPNSSSSCSEEGFCSHYIFQIEQKAQCYKLQREVENLKELLSKVLKENAFLKENCVGGLNALADDKSWADIEIKEETELAGDQT